MARKRGGGVIPRCTLCETYDDVLIKTSQPSIEIKRLRTIAAEIFKTLNDVSPNYIKEIFYLSPYETNKKYVLFVHNRDISSIKVSYLTHFNTISQ